MTDRIYSFGEKYNIFKVSQDGFRKNLSTTTGIYKYIQAFLNIINEKKYVVGVLFDLSKAYNRVQFKAYTGLESADFLHHTL